MSRNKIIILRDNLYMSINFLTKADYAYRFPKQTKDLETDVLIVGAGLTGALCALKMYERKRKVTLVEKGFIGRGKTSVFSGISVNPEDRDFSYDLYEKRTAEITKTAILSGTDFKFLPHIYFSGKADENKTLGGQPIDETHLRPFKLNVPQGVLFEKGFLKIDGIRLTKNLTEYLSLNGCEIYENTKILSAYENEAKTESGFKIKYKTLINSLENETKTPFFCVLSHFSGKDIPQVSFSDGYFSPIKAFPNKDGLTLLSKTHTLYGAFLRRSRAMDIATSLYEIPLKEEFTKIIRMPSFSDIKKRPFTKANVSVLSAFERAERLCKDE